MRSTDFGNFLVVVTVKVVVVVDDESIPPWFLPNVTNWENLVSFLSYQMYVHSMSLVINNRLIRDRVVGMEFQYETSSYNGVTFEGM